MKLLNKSGGRLKFVLLLSFLFLFCFMSVSVSAYDTSYYGIDVPISDFTFSSDTPVLVSSTSFNSSDLNTTYGVLSSFNVGKISAGGVSDVYVVLEVDGVEVHSEMVRSVDKSKPGSTGIKPFSFSVANGNHDLDIYFYRTGAGVISIYNIDFALGRFETPEGIMGRGNLTDINVNFTSTTPVVVYSKNISKLVNTSTYITAKLNFYTNVLGDTSVCHFQNGGSSPDFVSETNGLGDAVSLSTNYITHPESMSETLDLVCYSLNGEQVFIDGVLFELDMADNSGNTVNNYFYTNPLTNYSNPVALTGEATISKFNFTPVNGTSMFFSTYGSFYSNSGIQLPSVDIIVNSTTEGEKCRSAKERYTAGDTGNSFFLKLCDNLTVGHEYTFYGIASIPVGEELYFYDGGVSYFEVNPFDTSATNTAPLGAMISPAEGSEIYEVFNANLDFSDGQEDSLIFNLSVEGISLYVNEPAFDGLYSIDISSLGLDGIVTFDLTVCENETSDGFCGDSSYSYIIPVETSSTGGSGSSNPVLPVCDIVFDLDELVFYGDSTVDLIIKNNEEFNYTPVFKVKGDSGSELSTSESLLIPAGESELFSFNIEQVENGSTEMELLILESHCKSFILPIVINEPIPPVPVLEKINSLVGDLVDLLLEPVLDSGHEYYDDLVNFRIYLVLIVVLLLCTLLVYFPIVDSWQQNKDWLVLFWVVLGLVMTIAFTLLSVMFLRGI